MRLPCPKIQYVLEVRESQGVRRDSNHMITTCDVGGRLAVPGMSAGPHEGRASPTPTPLR